MCALHSLRVLLLDNNQLQSVPAQIGQLSKLERLLLGSNQLSHLPEELGRLTNLKVLSVCFNRLQQLPAGLGGCSSLEELDASSNAIAAVPPSLGGLVRLKTLQLDSNRVASVPAQLLQGCGALQTLGLHANPISAEALAATPGFAAFEARRRAKFDKALGGGALLGSAGLDEGVDRPLMPGSAAGRRSTSPLTPG